MHLTNQPDIPVTLNPKGGLFPLKGRLPAENPHLTEEVAIHLR